MNRFLAPKLLSSPDNAKGALSSCCHSTLGAVILWSWEAAEATDLLPWETYSAGDENAQLIRLLPFATDLPGGISVNGQREPVCLLP